MRYLDSVDGGLQGFLIILVVVKCAESLRPDIRKLDSPGEFRGISRESQGKGMECIYIHTVNFTRNPQGWNSK